jgi:hypothetical protein
MLAFECRVRTVKEGTGYTKIAPEVVLLFRSRGPGRCMGSGTIQRVLGVDAATTKRSWLSQDRGTEKFRSCILESLIPALAYVRSARVPRA